MTLLEAKQSREATVGWWMGPGRMDYGEAKLAAMRGTIFMGTGILQATSTIRTEVISVHTCRNHALIRKQVKVHAIILKA